MEEITDLTEYQKLVIGCCFLFFSLVALLFAIETWKSTFGLLKNSAVVEGTVMANSNQPLQAGDHGVAPIFWFRTPDGKEHVVQSKSFTNFPTWQVGDFVNIRYHRDNPNEAEIYSFSHIWLYPITATIFGLLFGAAAATFLWKVDRKALEAEFS